MKSRWKLALLAALLLGLLWTARDGAVNAPDKKLVGHFDKMCKIAEKGIASPHRGVQKLFSYYGRNTPEMMQQWGELLVTIEKIKSDKAHDDRARLAGRRLHKAISSCERTYERFALAIESDPEASKLLERGATRLSRTLELIFSGGSPSRMLPGVDELLDGRAKIRGAMRR
jgi:hypothetical protein